MKYVLVFGNPDIPEDSFAIEIADKLKAEMDPGMFEFIRCDSAEKLMDFKDKEFVILDVVTGIDDVLLIEDVGQLQERKLNTLHDFDLGFYLRLLNEIGELGSVRIIGIPASGSKIAMKVQKLLRN